MSSVQFPHGFQKAQACPGRHLLPQPQCPRLHPRDAAVHACDIIRFTARTLTTASPVPFGALIVETATGDSAAARRQRCPQRERPQLSHAELRAVRKATQARHSLAQGLHPLHHLRALPHVHGQRALGWHSTASSSRATIADANKHCKQIHIPARRGKPPLRHAHSELRRPNPPQTKPTSPSLPTPTCSAVIRHLEPQTIFGGSPTRDALLREVRVSGPPTETPRAPSMRIAMSGRKIYEPQ